MIGVIFIKKSGPTPGILAKQRNRIQKACYFRIGAHWHRVFLGEHFKNSAMSRYGDVYEPRKGQAGNPHPKGFFRSYTGRKLRKFGHTLPLVYTGESRRLAKIQDVRATSKGNHVVLHSRKLNFRNPKSKVNMLKEVRVVNGSEQKALVELFDATFQRGIKTVTAREEKKAA